MSGSPNHPESTQQEQTDRQKPELQTETPNCMYRVDSLGGANSDGKFDVFGEMQPDIACTRDAVLAYQSEDGNTVFACEFHAPVECLNALNISPPSRREDPETLTI